MIQSTGFFRAKTNSLIGLGQALVERYDGEVPPPAARPGHAARGRPQDGERRARQRVRRCPGITVDTHFGRLARRFGWTTEDDPVKVEHEVGALFPTQGLDDAQPPADLPRPPGVPRPHAGLRRVPGRRASARRTARARSTRSKAAKLVKSPAQVATSA